MPVTKETKAEQKIRVRALLEEHAVDFAVLARYMQILSSDFDAAHRNRIISIHHSFLLALAGADSYRRAHERGPKMSGATAHYVTEEFDALIPSSIRASST